MDLSDQAGPGGVTTGTEMCGKLEPGVCLLCIKTKGKSPEEEGYEHLHL